MCGPEVTNRPRGGALAALAAPRHEADSRPGRFIRADLAFHTPGQPGSTKATHARLTPGRECSLEDVGELHVVIHSSGDLTKSAHDCGLFRQFVLHASGLSHPYMELPLSSPLSLEVGNSGIIGRRVSVSSRSDSGPDVIIAEGIVGFNFLEQTSL
ncbi:hypothetical protein NOR_00542 [Metarhizium rileyi]|uniref:Uncharacterized protein n=1 Tax=Metarhizium rileyi (strain RCEF 4871) TaxID=1649241 RepID=A0A167KN61_METRR|nr:hypothetical protein NOR_00542 [Metarhizium rileyi RCEF 4871]